MAPVGGLLWRSLRPYQIWGANTDVGKTVFATILGAAVKSDRRWRDDTLTYLKPVSTGSADEADLRQVCLYSTPDIAAAKSGKVGLPPNSPEHSSNLLKAPMQDSFLVTLCHNYISRASRNPGWLFCETAGGVHSPGPSGTSQADLYRPLRLPAILIGDSKLGGISATISAFESLRIRGYDVEAVMLFENEKYRNHEYLTTHFQKFGIRCVTISAPPERNPDPKAEKGSLHHYHDAMSRSNNIKNFVRDLAARHEERFKALANMSTKAHETIWYPFTQQKLLTPENITAIDSASGDYFQTFSANPPPRCAANNPTGETAAEEDPTEEDDGVSEADANKYARRKKYREAKKERRAAVSPKPSHLRPSFDGSASWWTQGLGHANPQLTLAAAYAAGRYGHVMFAEAVHQPALQLAQMLLKGSNNPRLSRVFYSDNGSTGTEVAVKMALRAARLRYGWGPREDLSILGLKGSYHGDTMGAMDCSEPGTYNEKVEWYRGKGFWFDFPTVKMANGKWTVEIPAQLRTQLGESTTFDSLDEIFDVHGRDKTDLCRRYENFFYDTLKGLQEDGRKFGALMLEPVVLGAGGMLLVDPLFQRTLINVVRRSPRLFASDSIHKKEAKRPVDENNWSGLPVVFDEVFTGLYRLGRFSAASLLDVHPDITVNAKLLTGGLLPLATTMASDRIFQAFASDDKSDALLHGHSYTAHPVGCQVAVESVGTLQAMEQQDKWNDFREMWRVPPMPSDDGKDRRSNVWSVWSYPFVDELSQMDNVEGVWALGSVLAIHMKDDAGSGYKSTAARALQAELLAGASLRTFGRDPTRDMDDSSRINMPVDVSNVHSRVLGNVLYLMASQTSTPETIEGIEEWLLEADAFI
ncbi:Bifunctional dethiobiotin synthetase/7,8-diamino-pelargonic acid aminotransferase, mitochondrial [Diplodia seriata]|uniref:Bifunctional dethiobiotin synthetase/7,8-diamino-pelargonic acid aminotransferase, mitochondrial n=1 Tax=Diplodia seriata TaxID=420778 RepID=A0A1S8BA68_9PEZI|nr:Bifunctional dethiobiotin synthetase/7,8-diamino-pelargonic acid aminotransferase, mitochondrial [Diplodia seriata]